MYHLSAPRTLLLPYSRSTAEGALDLGMEVGAGRTGGPAGGGTKCGNLAVGIGSTCGGGVGQRVGTGLMNGEGAGFRGPCLGLRLVCKLRKLPCNLRLDADSAATWAIILTPGSKGTAVRPLSKPRASSQEDRRAFAAFPSTQGRSSSVLWTETSFRSVSFPFCKRE